ncbi:hypothetical protein F53441_13386 [Fusarium austroafricanum]|uniref:F-box domain-containing protein n=1 Tax=Fusarium austroafricanum TaxID=2364996 RepID=A0A8H4NFM6_9HYPO|nr:hypothetical protein F53441_13386 [Fusarium austroafricanum]
MSPNTLFSLPEELILQILEYFPKYVLFKLRFVNRAFDRLVTPLAFRAIRFRAYQDEPCKFIDIAVTEHLRRHVREVTIDTWNSRICARPPFMDAIPFISLLSKLETLHLRFNYDETLSNFWWQKGTRDEELRVLKAVFESLAGSWSWKDPEDVDTWDNLLASCDSTVEKVSWPLFPTDKPLPIKKLTVSNLRNFLEKDLATSPAFQTVMNSNTLKDLRLYIAPKVDKEPGYDVSSPTDTSLFHNLPHTWLTPKIASNLRVLSLYCHHPWGWLPKMDFRLIGVNGLPNLKTLALGNYEFSHWWQVEWFGSLGIEKLYLDECTVLHSEINWDGMERDTSETIVQDYQGEVHHFSNEGYYVQGAEKQSARCEAKPAKRNLRWHHIFSHWTKSMPNLRVFKLAQGGWDDTPEQWKAIDPTYYGEHYECTSDLDDWKDLHQQWEHTAFMHFECPAPLTTGTGIRKYGSEAVQEYGAVFPYVDFVEPWENVDYRGAPCPRLSVRMNREEEKMDKEVFYEFLTVVDRRRRGFLVQD